MIVQRRESRYEWDQQWRRCITYFMGTFSGCPEIIDLSTRWTLVGRKPAETLRPTHRSISILANPFEQSQSRARLPTSILDRNQLLGRETRAFSSCLDCSATALRCRPSNVLCEAIHTARTSVLELLSLFLLKWGLDAHFLALAYPFRC